MGKALPCSSMYTGGGLQIALSILGAGEEEGKRGLKQGVVAGASPGQLLDGLRDGDGTWCPILARKGFGPPH